MSFAERLLTKSVDTVVQSDDTVVVKSEYLAVRSLLISAQSPSTSPEMKLSSAISFSYFSTTSLLISVQSLLTSVEIYDALSSISLAYADKLATSISKLLKNATSLYLSSFNGIVSFSDLRLTTKYMLSFKNALV